VFRPVATDYSDHSGVSQDDGTSVFAAGSEVQARHIGGSPFAVIRDAEHEEYWHSHGCYIGGDGRQLVSYQLWEPKTVDVK
jgi:hypothetical protein